MTILTWATAAASLVGVVANIHHRRWCFAVWGVTNATWAAVDWYHGIYAQAALQAVYFALSVYGWIRWKTMEGMQNASAESSTERADVD